VFAFQDPEALVFVILKLKKKKKKRPKSCHKLIQIYCNQTRFKYNGV